MKKLVEKREYVVQSPCSPFSRNVLNSYRGRGKVNSGNGLGNISRVWRRSQEGKIIVIISPCLMSAVYVLNFETFNFYSFSIDVGIISLSIESIVPRKGHIKVMQLFKTAHLQFSFLYWFSLSCCKRISQSFPCIVRDERRVTVLLVGTKVFTKDACQRNIFPFEDKQPQLLNANNNNVTISALNCS